MKMMSDALPNKIISFLTTCCPMKAAMVATATKYRAASKEKSPQIFRWVIEWWLKITEQSRESYWSQVAMVTIRNRKTFQKVIFYNWHRWGEGHCKGGSSARDLHISHQQGYNHIKLAMVWLKDKTDMPT